jgi:hypothetical protein
MCPSRLPVNGDVSMPIKYLAPLSVNAVKNGRTSKLFKLRIDGIEAGKIELAKKSRGWEVQWAEIYPSHQRKGLATKAYNQIEKKIGQKMKPAARLKAPGYKFWQNRNAELVQNYRRHNGEMKSPNQLLIERAALRAGIRSQGKAASEWERDFVRDAKRRLIAIDKTIKTIPNSVFKPSQLRRTFAVGATIGGAVTTANAPRNRSEAARQAIATRRARGDFA